MSAHGELSQVRVDTARRQFQILCPQRSLDIRHRQLARGQSAAVKPDAHGIHLATANADACDAVEYGKTVLQVAARIVGELRDIHVFAGKIEPHDDVIVAVILADVGGLGLYRQVIEDGGDPVAYIVGGIIDIPLDIELDRNA